MIWNREIETAPRATLEALCLARLRHAVAWARARVPFYREALAGAPATIERLADLARLPFTGKGDLRAHYPFGLLAAPRHELARIHASSGTKGKPTVVAYTRADLAVWREVLARGLAAAGAEPGHMLHVGYGYGLFTGGLGVHDAAEHMGLTVIPASSGNTLRQILLLQDLRPDGLAATPSFALHIGEAMAEQGVSPKTLGIRYGIFGAEPWTEAMRERLEALWGLRAVDFYGLSEIIGPGVAAECAEAREGLHVNEDHFLPEIVDPATGVPLPPGAEGELVITCLTKEAFPILRYRTGDLTRLDGTPCRCGRQTVRMGRVKGRTDDMVVVKGVNVYPSQIEAALLAMPELAPYYLVIVDRTAEFPEIEVQVEPSEPLPATAVPGLTARVAERLASHLGIRPGIVIAPPRTIPRSEGKAVRIQERRTP
ncbi:MAG: phenylacetate--CoA ligase [Candidatus Rokubacteria bacterium]|nr:phenylacetate--CoA ligase [Candidatus Rokubacteria bacterium]